MVFGFMAIVLVLAIVIPLVTGAYFLLPFAIVFDLILLSLSIRIVKPNTVKAVEFL